MSSKMHSFDVDVAIQCGVNAAIIYQAISWWCEHNAANDVHFYDGYYWTYNSNKAFQTLFPYLSGKQISTAIQKLIDAGMIIKGNYNKNPYDRTLWYAVVKTDSSSIPKSKMKKPEMENENAENVKPIPVISPVISTVVYNDDDDNARAREDKPIEENPYGDYDSSRPKMDTVQQYAVDNISPLGIRAMEELNSFVDDLSDSVVRHAIDNALDNGKKTWGYVKAILNGYVEAGVKTIGDAKAIDDEYAKKKHSKEKQGRDRPKGYNLDRNSNDGFVPLSPNDVLI